MLGTSKRRRVTDERELRIPLEYGYVIYLLKFGKLFIKCGYILKRPCSKTKNSW